MKRSIKKDKVMMITPSQSSFITTDYQILSSQYDVIQNIYNWQNKCLVLIFMILQVFAVLKYARSIKAIVIQFGGHWSVIPSLIGKLCNIPVAIILHGTDCAKLPHIRYGSLMKKHVRLSCKISYNLASILLPVSDSLIYSKNEYIKKYTFQGVKHYFPTIKTPFRVIHNGLDTEFWTPQKNVSKEETRFITSFLPTQFLLKGGDLILNLAKKYSDANFYIAGCEKLQKISEIPNNIHFLGMLSKKELREQYRKSQFYFQLSMFEGFGLSLCEAMLCECIPIGSSANIIPEIIGDTRFVLHQKDEKELDNIVKKALSIKNKMELGKKARKRISEKYPLKKRKALLLKIIESI